MKVNLHSNMTDQDKDYNSELNYTTEELYDADPDCKHKVIDANGGGVKCIKCTGWFCF